MDKQNTKNQITYNEFTNLDIRVVEVIHAEPIPQRKRILKLTVKTGIGDDQTIVAGGAQFYSPEYFIGKKIAALLNLAPKQIAGIMSHGMLLAANVNNKPFWLVMDENTPVGAKII